jgi:hypothetical protein
MDLCHVVLKHVAICFLLVVSNIDARPLAENEARYRGKPAWGLMPPFTLPSSPVASFAASCLLVPRGGSEAPAEKEDNDEDHEEIDDNNKGEGENEDDDKEEASEKDDNEEDHEGNEVKDEVEEEEETPSKKDITSMEPFKVIVKTNLGCTLVDQSFELNAVRTRNIESIKKSLARLLPGKPPMEIIRLLLHGQVLKDDLLLDELMDDDEEDDDEADVTESEPALTLTLDMLPPVDIKYATELEERLPETSTADLLEAYTMTEAAIWLSSQQLITADSSTGAAEIGGESTSTHSPPPSLISFQVRQYATSLQARLEQHLFTEKASVMLDDPTPPAKAAAEKAKQPDVRGKRVRPGAAGGTCPPSSSVVGLKQTAQHYLNIVRTLTYLKMSCW